MIGTHLKTVSAPDDTFMNASHEKAPEARMAAIGRPCFVQYARNRGACPRNARPYRIRDELNRKELPAEKADVKMHALMMCGSTLMPARSIAMTYGDSAAVPLEERRSGSL